MSGGTPRAEVPEDVVESWGRVRSGRHRSTVDTHDPGHISDDELETRRAAHPLRDAVQPLQRLSAQSADDVTKTVEKALDSEVSFVTFTDVKGNTYIVPTAGITFIEVGTEESRRVGFVA